MFKLSKLKYNSKIETPFNIFETSFNKYEIQFNIFETPF